MREICKECKASPYEDYCNGDDVSCVKVMRYDMGYKEAINKAAEWISNHNADTVVVEQFKKDMEL